MSDSAPVSMEQIRDMENAVHLHLQSAANALRRLEQARRSLVSDERRLVEAIPVDEPEKPIAPYPGDAEKANSRYFRWSLIDRESDGDNLVLEIECPTFLRGSLRLYFSGDFQGASY